MKKMALASIIIIIATHVQESFTKCPWYDFQCIAKEIEKAPSNIINAAKGTSGTLDDRLNRVGKAIKNKGIQDAAKMLRSLPDDIKSKLAIFEEIPTKLGEGKKKLKQAMIKISNAVKKAEKQKSDIESKRTLLAPYGFASIIDDVKSAIDQLNTGLTKLYDPQGAEPGTCGIGVLCNYHAAIDTNIRLTKEGNIAIEAKLDELRKKIGTKKFCILPK